MVCFSHVSYTIAFLRLSIQTRNSPHVADPQGNLYDVPQALTPFLKKFLTTPYIDGGVHITPSPEHVPDGDHLPRAYESNVDSKVLALLTFIFPVLLEFIIGNQWSYNPELTDDERVNIQADWSIRADVDEDFSYSREDPSEEGNASQLSFSDLETSTPPNQFSELSSQVSDSPQSSSAGLSLSFDLPFDVLRDSLQDNAELSDYVQQPHLPPLPTLEDLGAFPPIPKIPLPKVLSGVALDPMARLVSNHAGRLELKRPDFVAYRLLRCLLICENKLRIKSAAVRQLKGYMRDLRSSNPHALGMACVGGLRGLEVAMFKWRNPDVPDWKRDTIDWIGSDGTWYRDDLDPVFQQLRSVLLAEFRIQE